MLRALTSKALPHRSLLRAAFPFIQNSGDLEKSGNAIASDAPGYNGHEMRIGFTRAAVLAAGVLTLTAVAFSQRFGGRGGGGFGGFGGRSDAPDSVFPAHAEFHFLRVEYSDYRSGGFRSVSRRGRASGWWAQDWPDAEEHF